VILDCCEQVCLPLSFHLRSQKSVNVVKSAYYVATDFCESLRSFAYVKGFARQKFTDAMRKRLHECSF
jgi:hypothetical protein